MPARKRKGMPGFMTVQPDSRNAIDAQEPRMLRAQLEIVGQSLPLTMLGNPVWAFLNILPYIFADHLFGDVPRWRIGMVMVLHFSNSAIAALIYRRYLSNSSNTELWLRRFQAFQMLIGLVWGAMIWLLWKNGQPVNNVLAIVPIVGVLWAYSTTRTMHIGVYLATVLPIVLTGVLRAATADGAVAHTLAFGFPVVFAYTLVVALFVRRQFETLLVTKFANDDMTIDLRHAHDEAIRKRFEAEAANASKTTFLANMSHELRTPLNAILGFSDIIANERLGPAGVKRYREYAFDINASGSHLLSIINDILDIAKIESGKMEIFPVVLDPHAAIDSAMQVMMGRIRERKQTVKVQIDSDAPSPYADERAMKQIVLNLVSNATKFTQEGGHIEVRGRRVDNGFELCVCDDGPGIPAALLDQIFQPFNQIDNRYARSAGGTGLGLSLVRGLAELHGGKAWIESAPGAGTRACVYFPVANVQQAHALTRALA